MYQCSFASYALLFACGTLLISSRVSAQEPTLVSAGQKAVDVVLKHYALNPLAIDDKGKALPPNGSWGVGKKAPAICPQAKETCLQVFYQVPAESVSCSWVVLLNEDGKEGKILEENKDAERYLIWRVLGSEAGQQINTRQKPTYPPIAEAAHVSGAVMMSVIVSETGQVQNASIVSGPEMLRAATLDAARAWTFKPLASGSKQIPYQITLVFTFRTMGPRTGTVVMTP